MADAGCDLTGVYLCRVGLGRWVKKSLSVLTVKIKLFILIIFDQIWFLKNTSKKRGKFAFRAKIHRSAAVRVGGGAGRTMYIKRYHEWYGHLHAESSSDPSSQSSAPSHLHKAWMHVPEPAQWNSPRLHVLLDPLVSPSHISSLSSSQSESPSHLQVMSMQRLPS